MIHNKGEQENVLKLSKNYVAAGYKVLEDQKFEKKISNFFLFFQKKFRFVFQILVSSWLIIVKNGFYHSN